MKGSAGYLKSILFLSTLFLISFSVSAGQWKPAAGLLSDARQNQVMVQVVKQSNTSIILNYSTPAVSFTPVAYQSTRSMAASRCAMGNANLYSEAGQPEVPSIFSRVIMPKGRTVESIKVTPKEVVRLPGFYRLSYGELQLPIGTAPVWSKPDAAIYESDAVFPAKTHEFTEIQYRCGIPIAYINLYPVSYMPKSGTVSYFKTFSVEITLKPDLSGGTDVKARPDRLLEGAITEENPEALSTYPAARDVAPDYRYLVIAPNSLINATETPKIEDLVKQRESQGFTCKVESLDNAGTTKEAIRSFIKKYYTENNTKFVLLVGDPGPTATIPCFMVGSEASDLPYQCLDESTWSSDYAGEVFIGRISAENGKEVSNQIYKILAYENNSGAYWTSHLSLGEELDNSTLGTGSMNAIEDTFPATWLFDSLFDTQSSGWTKDQLITKINSNVFSIIDHLGHSNTTYNMKLSNNDETKFTNTNFIFGKSQGCIPGKFQSDCIAERFTTQTRTGFFAGVWNSNYGYYQPGSPTGGSSHKVHMAFWVACWGQNMQYFGEFNEYSHRTCTSQKKDIVESNLFGCPAIKFRGKNMSPFIKVTFPNGGEKLELGSACDIKWGDNIDGNVKIELFKGGALKEVLASTTASDGSHIWQIPGNYQTGADYKIKITSIDSAALFDESDKTFEIMAEYFITPPYVQTFDTLDTGETILPTKWEQATTDNFDWLVWKNMTPTKVPDQGGATGASADHTSGSGNYIYVESSDSPFSGNPNKKVDFSTPKFRLSVLSNPKLYFWYHMFSSNAGADEMGELHLDICVDGTWKNDVFTVSKNQGDKWIEKIVDLNTYKGERVIFRFRAITGSGWASDICIDDFRIDGTVPINNTFTAMPQSYDLKYYGAQVHFQVPEKINANPVSLSLYNTQGKLIRTLVNEKMKPGFYTLPLNSVAAGLYVVTMEAKGFKNTINVVVQK